MKRKNNEEVSDEIIARRIVLPKEGELFGYVEEELGAAKMRVICSDGKIRLCRIPGAKKKYLWVKRGDYVIVKPWEIRQDRGDVIHKYTPTEVEWLRRKGYLSDLEKVLGEII